MDADIVKSPFPGTINKVIYPPYMLSLARKNELLHVVACDKRLGGLASVKRWSWLSSIKGRLYQYLNTAT